MDSINHPGEVLTKLVKLHNSLRIRNSIPILQQSSARKGSWQVYAIQYTHDQLGFDKPNRYTLDCIYYVCRTAWEYARTAQTHNEEPDFGSMIAEACFLYLKQFGPASRREWLEYDNGAFVRDNFPELVPLLGNPVDLDDEYMDHVDHALEKELELTAEVLMCVIDDLISDEEAGRDIEQAVREEQQELERLGRHD